MFFNSASQHIPGPNRDAANCEVSHPAFGRSSNSKKSSLGAVELQKLSPSDSLVLLLLAGYLWEFPVLVPSLWRASWMYFFVVLVVF